MNEAKKERLRSAQRAGQIAADADLDLFLDVLYAPLPSGGGLCAPAHSTTTSPTP